MRNIANCSWLSFIEMHPRLLCALNPIDWSGANSFSASLLRNNGMKLGHSFRDGWNIGKVEISLGAVGSLK